MQFGSDLSSCPNKAVESELLFGSDWKIWDPVSQKTINIRQDLANPLSIKLCCLFATQCVELLDIIVVVVSPLVNLERSSSLSDVSKENMRVVERGTFSVVYGSPEAWLKIDRWRKC